MRYGFYLPTRGPTATRDGIISLAREGERLGLHSAMIADHIVFPVGSESIYPYTVDGKHPSVGDALETFSILGVVAGATERLRLVTSVLVLPYRNPVLTAKMVASLDVLSGGRVMLGIGTGWLKEEFEALGSPDFSRRGAVTDEWITIFKQLWSQSPASFDGRFYRYTDIRCEPFPVQKPHPPIWVGGHSPAALRRTARHGDGWHPVGGVAASPLPPEEMRAHLETLKRLTETEGRDFAALTISYKAALYDTGVPLPDGSRRPFSGAPHDIAADIHVFAGLGIHELIFDFRGQSIAESVERLQRFAAEVMSLEVCSPKQIAQYLPP
jgi:probable F420-dependent oxidoreductase